MEVANPFDSAIFKGFVYFQGIDATGDAELWRSDGTAAGTIRVQDLLSNGSSRPFGFAANNSALLFFACTGGATCPLFGSRDPATAVQQLGSFQRNGPAVTDGSRFFFVDGTTTPSRL